MRCVVQRVSSASVSVKGEKVGAIEKGFLVLIGVAKGDQEKDWKQMAEKIAGLRIFEDEAGQMNLSLNQVEGSILAVSQFTLLGDARKGKRPSFIEAAPAQLAEEYYNKMVEHWRKQNMHVETGVFRAHMKVSLVNDGPVTLLLDSWKTF
ncbi:MAG: D-tyrosyl-tRNA(Tyr) deacylase [Clostridiales bacterium]|nr:D-tyrosyl-tRNA(Tyr) deacylase [Clostridiales bacterium]